MGALPKSRRAVMVLLGVLALLGIAGLSYAAAARPDFTVGLNPTSQSVAQGATATYTVTAAGSGGLSGAVGWSISGVPSGAIASFSPSSSPVTSTAAGTSTLTVQVGKSTAVGTYNLTVTGTSGKTKRTVAATLTVTRALNGAFTVSASPSSVAVGPGSTAVYTVTVKAADGFTGSVALAPYGSWPAGTKATFTPTSVNLTASAATATANLQVSTTAGTTPDGTYAIYVVGTGKDSAGRTTYQYARAELIVDSKLSSKPFSISLRSTVTGVAPGVAPKPLELSITNPNNQPLPITNLTVVVKGTSTSGCVASDYAVTQFSGAYPVTIPANATASLSSLGIPSTQWPTLAFNNKPAVNQNACKGATVALSFSGSAEGK